MTSARMLHQMATSLSHYCDSALQAEACLATSQLMPALRSPMWNLQQMYSKSTLTISNYTQAETYIRSQGGTIPSDALYIVYIGANDYLPTINSDRNHQDTVEQVLGHTAEAMELLYEAGARV